MDAVAEGEIKGSPAGILERHRRARSGVRRAGPDAPEGHPRFHFVARVLPSGIGLLSVDMAQVNIAVPEHRIRDFCRRWKIAELAVFGSVLRQDFRPDSDVDVLVTFAESAQWSLYDWVDMIAELREIFGRDVDLLSSQSLRNPFRRREILRTRETLYEG
jgi:hypothetical protein